MNSHSPLSSYSTPKLISSIALKSILVITALTTVFPFIWMLLTSFKSRREIMTNPSGFLPEEWIFTTYTQIWSEVPFARYFLNSLIFAGCVMAISLILNSLAGYAFARLRFKGRDVLFILILCTMMVPFQIIMTPLFLMINSMGLYNTFAGLILPRASDAFGIFMMRQFFVSLPADLEEAGRIDGANEFTIFFRIMLPLCKPIFITMGVFTFMGNWNDLLYPMILTSSDRYRPIQAAITLFAGKYVTDYGFLMTGLILASIPIIIAYLVAQKYFVEGIAITGIK